MSGGAAGTVPASPNAASGIFARVMQAPEALPFARPVIVGDGQMALVLADILATTLGDPHPGDPQPGDPQPRAPAARLGILSPFEADARALADTRRSPRLPGFELPAGVEVSADPALLAGADLVVCAIPTQYIRATFARIAAGIPTETPIVSVAKGIELDTFRLPCEILAELVPGRPLAALSGPTIAAELARRLPAALVAASPDEALAHRLQAAFTAPWTRIYHSGDMTGVELAGACKNVIAIAAGVVDGMGLGMNTKSALLARGLAEIARVGVALGGRIETFFGVAGVGDLATTCFAPEGRNRSFGERLARGAAVEDALASTTSVVEGVPTARALMRVARERGIDLPICAAVEAMVYDGLRPADALAALMRRETGPERIGPAGEA